MEPARARALARGRGRLRGHHLGEAARLRARRPRARAAAARRRRRRRTTRRAASSRSSIRAAISARSSSSRSRVGSTASAMTFDLSLEPHERWELDVDVLPSLDDGARRPSSSSTRSARRVGDVVAAWTLRVPRVRGGWESLRRAFDRSIADLAALRMRTGEYRRPLFAAGMPWFMTVFGRDTAITSLQTLLLGPEIAIGALDALTELQAHDGGPDDRRRAREDRPRGAARGGAPRPGSRATTARSTRRRSSSSCSRRRGAGRTTRRSSRGCASPRCSRSSGSTATATATATASSSTAAGRPRPREPVVEGLGRLAALPRRPLRRAADRCRSRCRATCTTRSADSPSSRARCGATRRSPSGSSARRTSSARASTRRSGSTSAAASTRSRSTGRSGTSTRAARTWATCSGAGSSRPERVGDGRRPAALGGALVGLGDPHDGERRGRVQPDQLPQRHGVAARLGARRLGARAARVRRGGAPRRARARSRRRRTSTGRCRRSSPGYARDETPFPIAYPTAARPQAWAAGTPILLVRVLLGIEPDRARQRLVSTVTDELPSWLDGLRDRGRPGVRAHAGPLRSSAAMSRLRKVS